MKKWRIVLLLLIMLSFASINNADAQCSICTKTAMQQGEKPAEGLNSGIMYLMFAPYLIIGFIGYRWWKNRETA